MADDPRAAARRAAAARLRNKAKTESIVGGITGMMEDIEAPYREVNGQSAYVQGGPQDLRKTAEQDMTRADELGAQAEQLQAEFDANDPTSNRAQALQAIGSQFDSDLSGLGAQDIIKTGALSHAAGLKKAGMVQDAVSDRTDKKLELQQQALDVRDQLGQSNLGERQRHNLETEAQGQQRLLARKRARTISGGTSSAVLQNYTPEAIEGRRKELESSGFSPNEVNEMKMMGPKQAYKVISAAVKPDTKVAHANTPNAVASGAGLFSLTPDGVLTIEKGPRSIAQNILREREKEKVGDQMVTISRLKQAYKALPPEAVQMYFAGKAAGRAADVLQKIGAALGNDVAQKLVMFDQSARQLSEDYGRKRSGAAISKQEWATFEEQLGTGAFSNPALFENGLATVENKLRAYDERTFGGRGAEGAVAAHMLASSPGDQPPWLKKIAQTVGKQQGLYVDFVDSKDRRATLPIDVAKRLESAGKGKIQ